MPRASLTGAELASEVFIWHSCPLCPSLLLFGWAERWPSREAALFLGRKVMEEGDGGRWGRRDVELSLLLTQGREERANICEAHFLDQPSPVSFS